MIPSPQLFRDISGICPRLRRDLKLSFHEFKGQRCAVLEDPITGKYHRIGLPEYNLIRLFDGQCTFGEAFSRASLESGSAALSENQAVSLLSWTIETRLADLGAHPPPEAVEKLRRRQMSGSFRNVFNLLFIRFPIGRPDRLVGQALPFTSWLCHPLFAALWVIVVATGIITVAINWDQLIAGTRGFLSSGNWLWLLLVYIGLKFWHECWHALVCRYYGGEVKECGVLLVLFIPLTYVDASSSWSLPSRWQRIKVAGAGIYGEFFLAGIAALVWAFSEPGLVQMLALNTMIIASVSTLLFNVNPLMRFDGYYILSDLLEIPNLATRSNRLLKLLSKKHLLAVKDLPSSDWPERETWIFLLYGLASLLWRLLVITTLLIAATFLFQGGGLLIAVIAFFFWLIPILSSLLAYLKDRERADAPRVWGAALRVSLITLILAAIFLTPYRSNVRVPGLLRYAEETIVRAEAPGFLTAVHVHDGQWIEEGHPLVTIENLPETVRFNKLKIDQQERELRLRQARIEGDASGMETETITLTALQHRIEEQQAYLDTLLWHAPHHGLVLAPRLPRAVGRYLTTGTEILRIVDPTQLEVVVPFHQGNSTAFRRLAEVPVRVSIEGRQQTFPAHLKRVDARATTALLFPELTAAGGGRLNVRASRQPSPREAREELVQPVFYAFLQLEEAAQEPLLAGERVRVAFLNPSRESLGYRFHRRIGTAIEHLFARGLS